MTEKEKRSLGVLYDANYDKELMTELDRCPDLCYEYNKLKPSDRAGQRALLEKILGRMGEDVTINPPFWCDYGYNVLVGSDFFANRNVQILDGAPAARFLEAIKHYIENPVWLVI